MKVLTWVLGAGGLLGSHLQAALRVELPEAAAWAGQGRQFSWLGPERLRAELADGAAGLLAQATADADCDSWAVLWCAGAGVVGTSAGELAQETAAFGALLEGIAGARSDPRDIRPGLIFLASSAGGVYAGNPERPLTEHSRTAPISWYGTAKLQQEELLARWAAGHPQVATLTARIANLYGPGQNPGKPQGLVSQLARAMIHHQPVHIYVPLDTLRDLIFADDCAALAARCLARLRRLTLAGERPRLVKILASQRETSIAEIVGEVRRLARRQPRVIVASRLTGAQQPADLRFRSVVWPELRVAAPTSLAAGIHRVYRDQLERHQAGRLPRPALA